VDAKWSTTLDPARIIMLLEDDALRMAPARRERESTYTKQ
jgi:hypothetical protein